MRYLTPAVLLSLLSFALAEDKPCTVTDTINNRFYDLSPLIRPSGEDYTAKDEATGNVYKINVCGQVHTETWKVSAPNTDIGIYRELKDGGQSLGQFTTQPHISHDVLSLSYLDGSRCPSQSSAQMGSVIAFVCDHGIYGTGQPEFVGSVGDCSFFFTWRTPHACSTTSRSVSSGLGVVFTAIFILAIVYFGGFFLYNRFVLKKHGREQLPPMGPTIVEAWSFVKDMAIIVVVSAWEKISGLLGRGGRFQGLPGDTH